MTIAEVSKRLGISADTLRYYERIGLIPPVGRSKSGVRDYSEKDCEWISFVRCMRTAGLSIESLTEYVRLVRQGNETAGRRKEILVKQRGEILEKIEELQEQSRYLETKISHYEDMVLPKEQEWHAEDSARRV